MSAPGEALREFNRDRVVGAVRGGTASRAGLCASTGLARSTVTALVRDLLAEGALGERSAPASERGRGRPARRLYVPVPRRVVVAVDLGHSHCQVALVAVGPDDAGTATATVLARDTRRLDVDASPEAAIDQAVALTRDLLAARPDERPVAGAIGLPAPVDVRTGAVGAGVLLQRWVHRRPAVELAERLGLPFTLDNDANLGALAEVSFGEARGATDLVYVKVATGIGAGLVLGGRIHHGRTGRAGEIGHVPVDPGGALCRCGNRGCLETLASVTQVLGAFAGIAGGPTDMAGVAGLVEQGDPGALRVVGDAGRLIGRALADLVNALDPERIVVGGQLALAAAPLVAGIGESVARLAQPGLARDLRISASRLEGSAELLGAAALAASLAGV